jgi:hypothetical protein
MNRKAIAHLISKICALVLISLCLTWAIKVFDARQLAKLGNPDSVPPDYATAHLRHMHQHPPLQVFFMWLFTGAVYIGAVELLSYVIRRLFPKKQAA